MVHQRVVTDLENGLSGASELRWLKPKKAPSLR